jgi:hypothetical protein
MYEDGNMTADFSVINNKLQTTESKRIKKVLHTDGFIPGSGGDRGDVDNNPDLFGGI